MVVYESMFGDNQEVARAVATGLAAHTSVEVMDVAVAPNVLPMDVRLLVVGGPNHAFGLSRKHSREDAARMAGARPISPEIGLREWLDSLSIAPDVAVVAWDTRMQEPRFLSVLDRATHGIEKRLRHRGVSLVLPAEHFYVTSTCGPLVTGEVARARRWGEELAEVVTPFREPAVLAAV
jgi:hypothetical protein